VALVASSGNFYGTTWEGGADGYGTVFQITPAGKLTTLQSFNWTDGAMPYSEGLAQGTDGTSTGQIRYPVTTTVAPSFKSPRGGLTTIHNFDYTDGCGADSGLTQATNGAFYGTSWAGGPTAMAQLSVCRWASLRSRNRVQAWAWWAPL